MVYIIQNPKIPDILRIFENIGQKWANFFQKWVPRLKIDISKTHFRIELEKETCYKAEIWPSYGGK